MAGSVVECERHLLISRARAPAPHELGGSGPTREENAGWGARAFDALLRWAILRGEVPE
jgi:hypothetical protein